MMTVKTQKLHDTNAAYKKDIIAKIEEIFSKPLPHGSYCVEINFRYGNADRYVVRHSESFVLDQF